MGTELQGKYQKLAQEYAKLRSQVDVLKKAIRDEQSSKAQLEEAVREKTLSLRKYVQENESLEFRNQQLSKRVAMLQDDLSSPARTRKKKGNDGTGMSEVHTQELAAKISENERLHMKLLELTQKSERTISSLENKIANLEREVATHNVGAEEVNREHSQLMEVIKNDKAMVEAQLAVQVSEVHELRKNVQRLQVTTHIESKPVEKPSTAVAAVHPSSRLFEGLDSSHCSLNVPVVDTKLQNEVLSALKGGLELFSTFTTQLSTFHSYLEQRCKTYPRDVTGGVHMSVINQKLCELLHESSSFTRPLLTSLTHYCDHLTQSPFSVASGAELTDFSNSHQKFVSYLETLTPYLQLSLEEESAEMICGPQLTESNERVSQCLTHITNVFLSIHDYLNIICTGPSTGISPTNVAHCLNKLQVCLKEASEDVAVLSEHFSTKIAQEYTLPIASQRLNTTNECIVSSLNGISSTAQQLSGFLQSNRALFKSSLEQSALSANKDVQSDQSSVLQTLRIRATGYMRNLNNKCPESIPYTLAVYNAKSQSSSSERQTFLQQVTANQDKLTKLEQEKETLILDLQLLKVKFEKEQKKVLTLDGLLAQGKTSSSNNPTSANPLSQVTAASNLPNMQALSDSVGCLSASSAEGLEKEPLDDMSMVRQHFVDRITEISTQVQDADSKAAYYYTECRGLHKQLAHSSTLRTKLAQDLDTARDALQQLQDQLATTSNSYEKQLSAMSDHLCEVNDKLLKQSDELEVLKKSSKSKRWTGKS